MGMEADASLSNSLGSKMLAKAFAGIRTKHPRALMLIEETESGPVYITIGSRPPELVATGRSVWGVYSPPEMHDPRASFQDKEAAEEWASKDSTCQSLGFELDEMLSGEQPQIRASVAIMLRRREKLLFVRIRDTKQWTIPEVPLGLGETAEAAARRAAKEVRLNVDNCYIPAKCPYVNTYFGEAGRHIVTLCMAADVKAGDSTRLRKDSIYDKAEWMAADAVPRPLFPMLEGILRIVDPECLDTKKEKD